MTETAEDIKKWREGPLCERCKQEDAARKISNAENPKYAVEMWPHCLSGNRECSRYDHEYQERRARYRKAKNRDELMDMIKEDIAKSDSNASGPKG
jgi:hypothetical protein